MEYSQAITQAKALARKHKAMYVAFYQLGTWHVASYQVFGLMYHAPDMQAQYVSHLDSQHDHQAM